MKNNLNKFDIISIFYPTIIVFIMWLIKLFEIFMGIDLGIYGLYPQTLYGAIGIITSPFLHSDISHLLSNTFPFILLMGGIFSYYKKDVWKIFFLIYFLSGFWTWIIARPAYHIGASGLVYGMAFFLILSAFFRKEKGIMAFALLIFFLYGSIIWGFFPQFFPQKNISWEGHLMGAVAGIIVAFYYKSSGPKPIEYHWDCDDYDDDDEVFMDYNHEIEPEYQEEQKNENVNTDLKNS